MTSVKLFHIIDDGQIQIMNALQYDGQQFFSCEYNRHAKGMRQIGVRVAGAAEVVVKQFERRVTSLVYNAEANIWHQKKVQWLEGGHTRQTDGIFGINVGGSFEVEALDAYGRQLSSAQVSITPGTMSIEQYKEMQHDVRRLFELFSYEIATDEAGEHQFLHRTQFPLFPLEKLQRIVEQLVELMNELEERPEVELQPTTKKVHIKDVRKWTPSIIIQHALYEQDKVNATVYEPATTIKENAMLREIIEQLLERIQSELLAEQQQQRSLDNEIEQLNTMIAQSTSNFTEKPKQLLANLRDDVNMLENREAVWQTLTKQLQELKQLSILQVERQTVEETHLFRMHVHYSAIYDLFMQYETLTPKLTTTMRTFIETLLKSPKLYEIWVFLKLVEAFSRWGLNVKAFVEDVQTKYAAGDIPLLSGYRKRFHLHNQPYDISLYYDVPIQQNEREYRPDFVIGLYNKQTKTWRLHTLDVKYKNYTAIHDGERMYVEDLQRSAYRYWHELFRNEPNKVVKTATIVHLDDTRIDWNIRNTSFVQNLHQHTLANFMFSPHNQDNLSIYLKRILHENSGFAICCPSCGKEKIGEITVHTPYEDKRRWKTTYKCNDCNELWVANFCGDCFYYNRQLYRAIDTDGNAYRYPRPLFKYPTKNYNKQVEERWDVHCPCCNKLARPRNY